MKMNFAEFKKYQVTRRPYPFDFERKQRILAAMNSKGIKTVSVLAKKIKMNQGLLSCIINGTRRSPINEKRIARFFKVPTETLFPPRSAEDLAIMNKKEKEREGAA